MPPRSKVMSLPEAVLEQLNAKLIGNGFGAYTELESWLAEQGYEIGKSSIQRYGVDFEKRCEHLKIATEQAKAICEAAPDDEGNMNEALLRLLQEKLLSALQKIDFDEDETSLKDIGILIARSSRASVNAKKWAAEAREEARKRFDEIESAAKVNGSGLDLETVQRVRREVYGIYDDL